MPNDNVKEHMTRHRQACADLIVSAVQVRTEIGAADQLEGQDRGEMMGNMTLAIRHLEDAAMRFGKVIQASAGGVSPLGGPNTPGH